MSENSDYDLDNYTARDEPISDIDEEDFEF